jgi:hypothetical protein
VHDELRTLLDDYVERFGRGEHPDPVEYRTRSGGAWPELADAIDRFLVGAAPPPPSPAEVEAMGLLFAGAPPLQGMRSRRGVPRGEVVGRLIRRFGFPLDAWDAVGFRYHQFECGLLPLRGVDEGVFEEVAGALGIERREVLPWRPRQAPVPVYARPTAALAALSTATSSFSTHDAQAREPTLREVDRIFGVDPGGAPA